MARVFSRIFAGPPSRPLSRRESFLPFPFGKNGRDSFSFHDATVTDWIIDFFSAAHLTLFQYAQETQHEKILRGLAVGIAFTMYGRLEEADPLVTSLCADKDPILRRSGMYTLAMAYCGTGNNQAIRKLLHVAVSIDHGPR